MKRAVLQGFLLVVIAIACVQADLEDEDSQVHVEDHAAISEFLDKYNIDLEGAKQRGEMSRVLTLVNVLTRKLNAELNAANSRVDASESKVSRVLRLYTQAVKALDKKHILARSSSSALDNAITQHRVYRAALKEASSQLSQTNKVAGYDLDAIHADKDMLQQAIKLVNDVLAVGGQSNMLEEDIDADVEDDEDISASDAMAKAVVVLRNKDIKQAVAIRALCQRMLKSLSQRKAGLYNTISGAQAIVKSYKSKVAAANKIISKHRSEVSKRRQHHRAQEKAVATLRGKLVQARAFAKMTRKIVSKDKSVILRELKMLKMLREMIQKHKSA